jgi:hypothetical protein
MRRLAPVDPNAALPRTGEAGPNDTAESRLAVDLGDRTGTTIKTAGPERRRRAPRAAAGS